MQKKVTIFIFIITILALLLAMIVYPNITQAQIPSHWNFDGTVDGYSPSWTLFMYPFLILVIDALICLTRKIDPKKKNFEKFNQGFQWIRICLGVLFLLVSCTMSIEAIYPNTINMKFIGILFLSCIFMVIGNKLPQIRQNYTMGIKTPWTLANEVVWIKTHRITGYLWFICGILFLLAFFLPSSLALFFIIFLLGICVVFPSIYSYILFKKLTKE